VSEYLSGAFPVRSEFRLPPRDSWESIRETSAKIDELIERDCAKKNLSLAEPAPLAQVARRLTLAIQGRIPSIAEISQVESGFGSNPLEQFTDRLLSETRYGDHVGEVISNTMVREQETDIPFPFRRDSYLSWLTDQLNKGVPYDQWVRQIITAEGMWSEFPEGNFITSLECQPPDLAAQTARSFLGLRLDCAQCHDHPFAHWKQREFHGLAAFFDDLETGYYSGLRHREKETPYSFVDRKNSVSVPVEPAVPFLPELDPKQGNQRERLAAWITHPDNPYFSKAIANRMWMLLFGRGLVEPIDDLDKPERVAGVLDLLSADFQSHGYDIRRLIRVISSTRAFRRCSSMNGPAGKEQEEAFACYPMTRIRPEPLSHSLSQTARPLPLDRSANVVARWSTFYEEERFCKNIGKPREDEVLPTAGSLSQRFALMNGNRLQEQLGLEVFPLSSQIAWMASSDESAVESAFLACLARRPYPDEAKHFVAELAGSRGAVRAERMADLFWCLTNSSEFSWNH
jgi:transcriptional regulator with XRE-family HTH domain